MPKWLTARFVVAGLLAFVPFEAEAKRYKFDCSYSRYASPEGLKTAEGFQLEFAFDDITGKAVMIGNNGVADVDAHSGSLGITFMEKLNGGVVQTTTIANDGGSIHSRHSIALNKMVPSQYYGRCSIK